MIDSNSKARYMEKVSKSEVVIGPMVEENI